MSMSNEATAERTTQAPRFVLSTTIGHAKGDAIMHAVGCADIAKDEQRYAFGEKSYYEIPAYTEDLAASYGITDPAQIGDLDWALDTAVQDGELDETDADAVRAWVAGSNVHAMSCTKNVPAWGTVEVAKTVTVTDEVTPEVAAAELARRAANRAAKRTGAPRTEPISKAAFKMSKAQLEGMVA